jgi:hypothetical protein
MGLAPVQFVRDRSAQGFRRRKDHEWKLVRVELSVPVDVTGKLSSFDGDFYWDVTHVSWLRRASRMIVRSSGLVFVRRHGHRQVIVLGALGVRLL